MWMRATTREPAILYDADSAGAKAHLALAKELLQKNNLSIPA